MSQKRGQNEGSIYKHGDGRWRAIVPSRQSGTGKRFVIYGSKREGTNTREAVAKKLAEYLAGRPGPVLKPDRETVESYLRRWLLAIEAEGELRPKTVTSYAYTVSIITPLIGGIRVQALQPEHVRVMMRRIKADGRAPRTVTYARSILGIALGAAVAEKVVTRNVASRESMGLTRKRTQRRKIEVLTAGTIAKILTAVPNPADRLLLETIATFGLRVGESLGLEWKDIDFDAGSIQITRAAQRQPKTPDRKSHVTLVDVKTENARRALLVHAELLSKLKGHHVALLEHRLKVGEFWQDHDLVFPSRIGTPQDARNVLRVLHAAQAAAGVARSSLHRLRHSAATYMRSQDVPMEVISSILGHSTTKVTREFYAAFELVQQKQASAVMAGAFTVEKKKK